MTPLVNLPADIANIFTLPKKSFGDFIAYEAFSEVISFACRSLGNISGTVNESSNFFGASVFRLISSLNYLESKFDTKIDYREADEDMLVEGKCRSGTHPDSLRCLGCGEIRSEHKALSI